MTEVNDLRIARGPSPMAQRILGSTMAQVTARPFSQLKLGPPPPQSRAQMPAAAPQDRLMPVPRRAALSTEPRTPCAAALTFPANSPPRFGLRQCHLAATPKPYVPAPILSGNIDNLCDEVDRRLGLLSPGILRQATYVGAGLMTVVGTVLGFCSLGLGGAAMWGIGVAALAVCVMVGVVWNLIERGRKLPAVRCDPQQFRATLTSCRDQLRREGCPRDHRLYQRVRATLAKLDGGFGYALAEILRGVMPQVVAAVCEKVAKKYQTWREVR